MVSDARAEPRRRARRADAVRNRQAIVDAALTVLAAQPEASLEEVAAEAKLSRRALYGHFASREELLDAVLVEGATRVAERLDHTEHPDPRVEIALYGALVWDSVDEVRALSRLVAQGAHRDRVARHLEPLRSQLREAVVRGVETAAIRTDIEAASLARLIEGAIQSALAEGTRTFAGPERGRRLMMLTCLGLAGLGAREAAELIDSSRTLRAALEGAVPYPQSPPWARA